MVDSIPGAGRQLASQLNHTAIVGQQPRHAAPPSVLIIIVYYDQNSLRDTLETLCSLAAIDYPAYAVVTVNNGMAEAAGQVITAIFPDAIQLHAPQNLGFAGGNNLGIDYGLAQGYDLLLLLNCDVAVAPDFLSLLVQRLAQDRSIGLVGPRTYYHADPARIWADGGYIIKWRGLVGGYRGNHLRAGEFWAARRARRRQHRILQAGLPHWPVDYLPGSCVLVKREVFAAIGSLADAYFAAYEEAEFALRAQAAGYRVEVETRAHIWHKIGLTNRTAPELTYNAFRNRLLFLARNYPRPLGVFYSALFCLTKLANPAAPKSILVDAVLDHLRYTRIEDRHLARVQAKYQRFAAPK